MGEKENSISSCKWSMEEREEILASGTLEQKKEAFKDDEELMRETTKFVSEVIETAATEASKRKVHLETGDANEGKGKIEKDSTILSIKKRGQTGVRRMRLILLIVIFLSVTFLICLPRFVLYFGPVANCRPIYWQLFNENRADSRRPLIFS